MIRVSTRYQLHLLLLFATALIPVAMHSYAELQVDRCKHPERLRGRAAATPPTPKRDRAVRSAFDAFDWWTGPLAISDTHATGEFTVIRSYHAKRLYYRAPERLLPGVPNTRSMEWIETPGGESLPVHKSVYPRTSLQAGLVLYLLVHEGEPVSNAYLAQLLHAPIQMTRAQQPLTLFLVSVRADPSRLPRAEQIGKEWLLGAWQGYRSACRP